VYQGLFEDGVAPALAATLARNPDYVGKCPVCDSTKAAFEKYGKLSRAPVAAAGRGLPEEWTKKLNSGDADVRRAAMRDLVQRYIDRGYERANFKADEKAAMEAALKAMEFKLKDLNGSLPNGLKFCPSCDGTCRVRQKLNP